MLYHPALNIPERGMTGRYMPAGVNKDGIPLISLEFRVDMCVSSKRKQSSKRVTGKNLSPSTGKKG